MFYNIFFRMNNSIEFELKDFNNVFNQNKEVADITSAKYKYGEYNWCIRAYVKNFFGDLWLIFYLCCESVNKSNFPLFANMKYSVLNKDKDSRKDLLECNFSFYFDFTVKYARFISFYLGLEILLPSQRKSSSPTLEVENYLKSNLNF